MTPEQRNALIDNLVLNCSCWQGDGGKEALKVLPDDRLTRLNEAVANSKRLADENARLAAVAKAATDGITLDEDGIAVRLSPEGKWERASLATNARKAKAPKMADMMEPEPDDEDEDEDDEEDYEPPMPPRQAGKRKKKGAMKMAANTATDTPVKPVETPATPVTANTAAAPAPVPAPAPAPQVPAKPATLQDWLALAPPEAQAVWNSAMESHNRERSALLDRLTANVAAEQKDTVRAVYAEMGMDKLRTLATAVPVPAGQQGQVAGGVVNGMLLPNYSGAAVLPTANSRRQEQELDDSVLPMPSIDYAELAREQRQARDVG